MVSFIKAANQHGDKYSGVEYIGDTEEDARDSCVYGIGVNHMQKRITVWFRGTVMDDGNGANTWKKNFGKLKQFNTVFLS